MMKYVCTHEIEACQWTLENKDVIIEWILNKGWLPVIEKTGRLSLNEDEYANPGEWLLWSDDEFYVMDDESFRFTYKAVV